MKIADSHIQMSSRRVAAQSTYQQETLTVQRAAAQQGAQARSTAGPASDQVNISESARLAAAERSKYFRAISHQPVPPTELARQLAAAAKKEEPKQQQPTPVAKTSKVADLKTELFRMLVKKMTGRELETTSLEEIVAEPTAQAGQLAQAAEANAGSVWQAEYSATQVRHEYEKTSFQAQGVIHTQDGARIEFTVDLQMSREFIEAQQIKITAGTAEQLKDPLVLNYDGNAADLTQTKFAFDLDADGVAEQISFVKPGSGFLALDKNGDGVVNNGSELFGATSGDGFAELARYDDDANSFIDERDAIFDQLQIWSKSSSGENRLSSLNQRNVGAIYLGHINTNFELKDSANVKQGEIAETGLYIKEDKTGAGTVQHVNLVI